MSDRTNIRRLLHAATAGLILAILAGFQSGCSNMEWGGSEKPTPQTTPATVTPQEESVGDSRKFQPPHEAAPEDVEAYQNAVDQIGRLEYGQAESELRILLVRFESVDDPRYVSETLFWLGYCCDKQGVFDQARDYYQRVVEHYPSTRPGKQAAQRLKLLPAE